MTATSAVTFSIARWRAWAPGLDGADAWQAWSHAPNVIENTGALPDVNFLPAMQRRRLSPLARMLFYAAWPLVEEHERLPLVFVSRHGETPRTLALLQELARGEPLSPAGFSLSVHHAPAGLWSIVRGDDSEMSALAAAGDGLEHGVLEACGLLAEGAPAALLVVAEQSPAPLYQAQIDDVPFSYVLALRLCPGEDWCLQHHHGAGPRSQWPHALELVRALCLGYDQWQHHCKHRQWNWSCQHH